MDEQLSEPYYWGGFTMGKIGGLALQRLQGCLIKS